MRLKPTAIFSASIAPPNRQQICAYSADYIPKHRMEMIAVNIHTGTVQAVSSEPVPAAAGIAAQSVAAFSHLLTVTHVYIQVTFIDI